MTCLRLHALRGLGLLPSLVLGTALGLCAPAWARGGDCVFLSGNPLVLVFGVLDPSVMTRIQQRASATRAEDRQAGDCARGTQMQIQVEGGQHDAAGRLRMKHTARHDAYLPYAVQATPATQRGPGNRRYLAFDLVGRIEPADIATARGGTYSDTLRISVTP